jgi:hypothetical protein
MSELTKGCRREAAKIVRKNGTQDLQIEFTRAKSGGLTGRMNSANVSRLVKKRVL